MFGGHSLTEVIVFFALIALCLWFDLHAHKADKPVTARNAALWTGIWVSLAMAFAVYIGIKFNAEAAQLFIAGYLLEESLSVDNLFVMMAIFASFGIKDAMQHRVLYYGILGALVMRFLFVAAGSSLVALFGPYALAGFGAFVLWTAWKMWQELGKEKQEIEDFTHHWAVRYTKRFIPVHTQLVGHDFFVRVSENGKHIWKATPLFLCLVVVELSDVMFAFDSVPAIIAITQDPFLVYTSNIFAILGLRSMYFLLAAAKRYLRHLEKSVVAILAFIGVKMLLAVAGVAHIPPMISLAVVAGLLVLGILASFLPEKEQKIS
ncbi:MAG: TerC family protein [Desulfovibrionaceae bacterium]|nr:TerC family protein [Desulfovibrionaceae bacterium]